MDTQEIKEIYSTLKDWNENSPYAAGLHKELDYALRAIERTIPIEVEEKFFMDRCSCCGQPTGSFDIYCRSCGRPFKR